jgi:hypothetical protein
MPKKRDISPDVVHYRGQIGGFARAARARGEQPDDNVIAEVRTNLAAATYIDHVRKLVDNAPPLSAQQRERLAVLLRPCVGDD